jgi:hypothetical protein
MQQKASWATTAVPAAAAALRLALKALRAVHPVTVFDPVATMRASPDDIDLDQWEACARHAVPKAMEAVRDTVNMNIIDRLMPVQQNSVTHRRALLVLHDRGILAHATSVTGHYFSNYSHEMGNDTVQNRK